MSVKQYIILSAALVLTQAMIECEAGEIIQSAENGRVWQTNLKPSEPLSWPWAVLAGSARLTITNHCAGTVSVETVTRTADDLFGSYLLVVPASPEEQLYSIGLEQYCNYGESDQKLLDSAHARVAYIPGVNGAGTTVRANTASAMKKSEPIAVFAYDAAWRLSTATATVARVTWMPTTQAGGDRTLPGTGGYDVLSVSGLDLTALELAFDGIDAWSGSIRYAPGGTVLTYR